MEMITSVTETMVINIAYAIICIVVAITAMAAGYTLFDKLTSFNTDEELKQGNIAVAIFYGCIALGIAICSGLVIGLSCN